MPIHSVGYRAWDGHRVSAATRWTVIAASGIRRTWKSRWLRRMLFVAVMPAIVLAIPLFMFEQAVLEPATWREFASLASWASSGTELESTLDVDLSTATPEEILSTRYKVWSFVLLTLFRYPQVWLMVLVIGIAAPPLISDDVRTRAFLIYFSRPITRLQYILGKMATMVFFLCMITTLPAILLYGIALLLSPTLSIFWSTWDLPLRILAASATLILPTVSLSLMFSSVTSASRYAGFAWFAVWILGYVTFTVVFTAGLASTDPSFALERATLFSPYHILGTVQAWVFGLSTEDSLLAPAAIELSATTVISLSILYHRVSAPMRA